MIRAVVLDHTADLGGAELALLRWAEMVDRGQIELTVVLFADGPLRPRLAARGVRVVVVPLDDAVRMTSRHAVGRLGSVVAAWRLAPFALRLIREVHRLRPDVLQTNSLKSSLIGCVVARLTRVPLVWYVHDRVAADYLPRRVAGFVRWCARSFPRAVLVNSQATASTLPSSASRVVYPGYAPEQVRPDALQRSWPDPPVVGMIGRVSRTKGQFEFVRAAVTVLREFSQARFRIVGSPMFGAEDYAARVRAEAAASGIENALEWVGFADDPGSALDGLTVLVHASPTPEPFGQVIIEAMIRGVPVIATRGGGVTEIFAAGAASRGGLDSGPADRPDFGLLVPPGDVQALAGAIMDVLSDPAAARSRAAAAYQHAQEQFSVATTAEQIIELWREVVWADGRSGPGAHRRRETLKNRR